MRKQSSKAFGEIALGALAGTAATWAMGQATSYLYENEPEAVRQREDQARDDKTTYEVAAEKAAGLAGKELTEEDRKKLGSAIHWALGIGSGAVYGLLRRRLANGGGHGRGFATGALFGAAVWLLFDEMGTVALGLAPGPRKFPWQTHARGLLGHLVLGLAAEGALQAADQAS